MKKSFLAASLALCCAVFAAPSQAAADAYPSRPITLVVPYPAGSTTDNVARKMAEYLRGKLNANVLVDNRVGADGNIAAKHVLRQPADGYTVFVTGNSVHGANANLYKQLPFDPVNDFALLGGVMSIPMVLTVRPDFPANTVQEFVAAAKKSDKRLFFGTGNNSTLGASELFKARFSVPADRVPYRGSPQVVTDLLAGQFDYAFIDANVVGPFLRDGKLKGLAVTASKRLDGFPNLPTVAESLPGFSFGAWVGVTVRAGTPTDIASKLAALVGDFAKDPATATYLGSIGSVPMPMDPARFKQFVISETKVWAEIVKVGNVERK